jgi:hypothetical protein
MDDRERNDDATYPEIISAYSRAQAIDDGVIVDVTQPLERPASAIPSPSPARCGNDASR